MQHPEFMPKVQIVCGEVDEEIFHVKNMYSLLVDCVIGAQYFFVELIGAVVRFKSSKLSSTAGLATDHGESIGSF